MCLNDDATFPQSELQTFYDYLWNKCFWCNYRNSMISVSFPSIQVEILNNFISSRLVFNGPNNDRYHYQAPLHYSIIMAIVCIESIFHFTKQFEWKAMLPLAFILHSFKVGITSLSTFTTKMDDGVCFWGGVVRLTYLVLPSQFTFSHS